MRNVENAGAQLLTDVRPGHFADKLDFQAFLFGETEIGCNQQGRGVDKRYEPGGHFIRHRKSSAAVTTDWAISAIFFFSFIAVLRRRR